MTGVQTCALPIFRRDRHIDARQMVGKRATVGAAFLGARPGSRRILLVFVGFICRNHLFDILKRKTQLLGIELLRTAAKLRALQLAQKMAQPIILRQCLVALDNRGITLGTRCHEERLQRVDVHRQLRCGVAHARN